MMLRTSVLLIGSISVPTAAQADWGEPWGSMIWGASVPVPVPALPLGLLAAFVLGVLMTLLAVKAKRGHRTGTAAALLAVGLLVPAIAVAATISVPNTFQNGTVADADEVNANFDTIVVESNDQHTRLDALETASCPANTAALGSYCMDTTARAAASFTTAVNTCVGQGGKICGLQELTYLCLNPSALGGTPLTSGTYHYTGEAQYRNWSNDALYVAYDLYREISGLCVGDYGPNPSTVTRTWTNPASNRAYYCCLPR